MALPNSTLRVSTASISLVGDLAVDEAQHRRGAAALRQGDPDGGVAELDARAQRLVELHAEQRHQGGEEARLKIMSPMVSNHSPCISRWISMAGRLA